MGVRCGRGVLVGGYVGVAARAVIVAITATDVSRVSGVGDGPGVGVSVIVGVSVGVSVAVPVTRRVADGNGDTSGDCNGGTNCHGAAATIATDTAARSAAAFHL